MKKLTLFLAFLIISISLSGCSGQKIAATHLDEFEVTVYEESAAQELYDSVIVSVSDTYTASKGSLDEISNFDVSEKGLIVVGVVGNYVSMVNPPMDHILVFDTSQNLHRCIEYYYFDSGSIFVEWKGNNILIFDSSGHFILEITVNGELVNVYDVDYTIGENNKIDTKLSRQLNRKNPQRLNGIIYEKKAENDLGYIKKFTSITATNPQGETTEFFSVKPYANDPDYSFVILPYIVIGGLIGTTVIPTIVQRIVQKKLKKEYISKQMKTLNKEIKL